MSLFDTYSKRRKRADKGGRVDPLIYDELPDGFRNQVCHIWKEAVGLYQRPRSDFDARYRYWKPNDFWRKIERTAAKAMGFPSLGTQADPDDNCHQFLCTVSDVELALDLIEVSFAIIHREVRIEWEAYGAGPTGVEVSPDEAIDDLNACFAEHSLGYQFSEGQLIRIDSQFMHAEVVAPALTLLHTQGFAGAEQEFMQAHEHYREGRFPEVNVSALSAFESTMKTIAVKRQWTFDERAQAKDLIRLMFDKKLIPSALDSHLTGVRTALEGGLPTLRNRMGAHGQGAEVREVPHYLAAHALHLAGANIVLLVQAHLDKPSED